MYTSNAVKKYFRVLEIISSLNCELENKSELCRKEKIFNLQAVALSLTVEFRSTDSADSLFNEINKQQIPNFRERSQFSERRRKLFYSWKK